MKDLIVLSGEETVRYRNIAEEAGMSLAPYLMQDMADEFLVRHEDAYRVIQVYDEELKRELIEYMEALDYQRYRRNAGYQN